MKSSFFRTASHKGSAVSHRPTPPLLFAVIVFCLFEGQAAAADDRLVDKPSITPLEVSSGVTTTITVSARIGVTAALIPTSVTLIRYDDTGKLLSNLGQMFDDGTHGDVRKGDGVYTLQVPIQEAQPQLSQFKVSVAYKGSLSRTLSDYGALYIQSTVTPEQVLATIAGSIRTGDTTTALKYFTASSKNRDVLVGLSGDQQAALASAFQNAKLVKSSPNKRDYLAPVVIDNVTLQREISMSRTGLNEWYVMSW